MSRINLLDKDTFNKIAAGEVVERPFSVVKELVENSIDAGSKNIVIEIEDGGQKIIKITDDGCGIYPDDIEKAFLPHSTSKIKKIEDVFTLSTMGFRGEALASISSVSKTILKSRVENFSFGREIYIEGGTVTHISDVGANVGTTIEVRDLFYNVPARLKFLKSSSREASLISDIIYRLALSNPNISFKLINNNKTVVNTYGTGNIKDVIRTIYNKNTLDNIIEFEQHSDILSVYGFIGNAEISRGSRNHQSIFVNKRYIKNRLITTAVENAFKSFLTVNKFPFFIVFIQIFPEYVDVNVHPTKTEIKFKEDRLIFTSVFNAVHKALRDSLVNSFNIDVENNVTNENVSLQEKNINSFLEKVEKVQIPIDLESNISFKTDKIETYNNEYNIRNNNVNADYSEDVIKETSCDSLEKNYISNEISKDNIPGDTKVAKFSSLRIIGQFNSTYILAEGLEELYIIDQHAAHEKILFEKYRNNIKKSKVKSQVLLTPLVIELLPDDFIYYVENKDIFTRTGFNIEVFGENTISIREVPYLLGKPELNNLFMEIIDNIKNLGTGSTVEVKYNTIAKLACKSAIKAHDKLSPEEMKTLLEDLRYIEDPFTCPHGRPTIIKITLNELEKRFKRIQ
ncbi:DNA mismatch repair protein MutL [Clostridium tetanomorphum]|uniref:DNA mismatch repair protein MutL n=1 Tax=Clostridium tetanomorphum TaxID=1553 RepID=A0A923EER4_CLOTT|nr:DNA mismatch repair endonuclease MutL [Clostridium tetanomorphum]MBP1864199.1 DNA mismatch repair protein MutL [Clostridium tetanomorphum]NRS84612.1 DNA mismatch repair protein MutL [Clostridium tetanomorphum]NRZ97827.1 DNA mismatch repair protein MutL [Clostridium tetanomorphum]